MSTQSFKRQNRTLTTAILCFEHSINSLIMAFTKVIVAQMEVFTQPMKHIQGDAGKKINIRMQVNTGENLQRTNIGLI